MGETTPLSETRWRTRPREAEKPTCLIESGNQLTVCLPDVCYQPVTHLLEIFLVALQIACQQFFLAKDPKHVKLTDVAKESLRETPGHVGVLGKTHFVPYSRPTSAVV
jgi:hypothetical protein